MTSRMMSAALFLVLVWQAACGARAGLASRCEWPNEPRVSIDLKNAVQQRHLRQDAETAETIALRFADGREEGRIGSRQRTRERCEASLWNSIARVHGVTPNEVRNALRRQNDTPFEGITVRTSEPAGSLVLVRAQIGRIVIAG